MRDWREKMVYLVYLVCLGRRDRRLYPFDVTGQVTHREGLLVYLVCLVYLVEMTGLARQTREWERQEAERRE